MSLRGKPTLCIDFDGVIHDYKSGWQGGEIYGNVTPGFFEWAKQAQEYFVLTIYSSRSKDEDTRQKMVDWLLHQMEVWQETAEDQANSITFAFCSEKPAAWLTIDDRCIRFDGNWNDPALQPGAMLAFLPWMHRPAITQEG